MAADTKTSMLGTFALVVLGLLVLIAGEKSLVLVIPAAVVVCYRTLPRLRGSRN